MIPNLFQRFGIALRLAFGNWKAIATMVETWREERPSYPEVNFVNMVKYGWRRNELIFACITKTANTTSQVKLQVIRQRNGEQVVDHPMKRLIESPIPYMSEADFWSAIILYQKLAGRAVFEKERSQSGHVVRLWPLRPDWLRPLPSSKNVIRGYLYEPPGLEPVPLDPEDVLDFKLFDPINTYHGYPPVAVAARVGDMDNAVTDYLKIFFEKGGTPPGLLKTVQKLNDTAVGDIRRRWRERYGGAEHWLEPAVLDSDAEYQRIGLSFDEMGFDVLDARNEARICAVLDVPPILVGAKIGLDRATYSNYAEARRAWWQDSLIPLYVNLNDTIANQLVPEFGDDITTDWDFSEVPALQEDRDSRWKRATEALRAGGITVNEFYAEVGLPDRGPAGDVYLRPMVVVETPASSRKALPAPREYKVAGNAPDDDERRRIEREMDGALRGYFSDQIKKVKEELAQRYAVAG